MGSFLSWQILQVPCICKICQDRKEPNFYEYDDLLRRKEVGKTTVECKNSYNHMNVLQLIDSVFVTTFFTPKTLKMFISYSKVDKAHLNNFTTQLAPLKRDGILETWDDSHLLGGDEWDKAIRNQLATADVIVLLVSADYLATEYAWKEMEIAITRHERSEAVLIPVIVRPCAWADAPFARFNALPDKGTAITKWENQDEAWLAVVEKIKQLIKKLR